MTFSRQAGSWPVHVSAHMTTGMDGKPVLQIGVGNSMALLSEEDAASLGGYLLGVTNNDPIPEGQQELPTPADLVDKEG